MSRRPQPPEPIDHAYNIPRLNRNFALASVATFIAVVMSIGYDYNRGWKERQKEYLRYERQKTAQAIKEAQEKLDRDALAGLQAGQKQARDLVRQHRGEISRAESKLEILKGDHYRADQDYRFTKAEVDSARFDFEDAHEKAKEANKGKEPAKKGEVARTKKELDTLIARRDAQKIVLEKIVAKEEALTAQVQKWRGAVETAEKGLKKLHGDEELLLAKQERLRPDWFYYFRNLPVFDFINPSLRVQQVLLPGHYVELNYMKVGKVDRCMTCHRSIDKKGYESKAEALRLLGELERRSNSLGFRSPADEAEQKRLESIGESKNDVPMVFRTHPNLDAFVSDGSPHPLSTFGCTPCHGGRDRSVDFGGAGHVPRDEKERHRWIKDYGYVADHFLETPMYPLHLTEAGCYRCHSGGANYRWRLRNVLAEEVRADRKRGADLQLAAGGVAKASNVAMAPSHSLPQFDVESIEPWYETKKLDNGVRLVESLGCFGCHKIKGWENRPKVGPSLEKVASKTTPDWAEKWIADPAAFRKSTRMPSFFHLENFENDPNFKPYSDVMIRSITAFLFERSDRPALAAIPVAGNAERGKSLIAEVGCYGCHSADPEEARNIVETRRQFGPNLSGVGSKASKEWIYQWIKDPKSWNPATRMPNLRLSDQEAADIAAYVSTLKAPASFDAVPAPVTDSAIRDRLVREFLRMTKTDAATKVELDAMDEHSRDIYLGEKLVAHYGCYACHNIKGFENAMPIGTELSDWGNKAVHRLDFGFLETPPTAHEAMKGRIPATKHDWLEQKLKEPRSFDRGKVKSFDEKLKMPWFRFSQEEIDGIRTVVLGLQKEDMAAQFKANQAAESVIVERGRRIVRDHNCQGCHLLDQSGGDLRKLFQKAGNATFGPPILKGEGHKVQPDWLASFLRSPRTGQIRPWLKVRMPTFDFSDDELNSLTAYFAAADGAPFPFDYAPIRTEADPVRLAVGTMAFETLKCQKCHPATEADFARIAPEDVANAAPILQNAWKRLRYDWIADWIKRPEVWMPGTKMPGFFPTDGAGGRVSPLRPDMLDSFYSDPAVREAHRKDVDWVTQALRDKVWSLGAGAPAGASSVPSPRKGTKRAEKSASGGGGTPHAVE